MFNIGGDTVNEIFQDALWLMKTSGVEMDSRAGRVKMLPAPVCITYKMPQCRVLFSPKRDANPFFHLMESLWMLAGRQDVSFLKHYSAGIDSYSEDHAAYGWRWRRHFGFDQLEWIANELRRDNNSRRCVLQIWDAWHDPAMLKKGTKDVPCNTQAYFAVRPHGLDITVLNRSNDLVWGALGANAVQFSFLLEWMSWRIGVPMGRYHQISNNLHIYEHHWWMLNDIVALLNEDGYPEPAVPMVTPTVGFDQFDYELNAFLRQAHGHTLDEKYTVPFLQDVAAPMAASWNYRKLGYGNGLAALDFMVDCDWKVAAQRWIERRAAKTS